MASLKSGHSINKVFIQEGLKSESIGQIIAKAKKQGLVIQRVSKSKLDTLANGQNHQGVVLAVASFEYASLEQVFELAESRNEAPFVVILDGIEDPHNLGYHML